jgi:hypothetical protein
MLVHKHTHAVYVGATAEIMSVGIAMVQGFREWGDVFNGVFLTPFEAMAWGRGARHFISD